MLVLGELVGGGIDGDGRGSELGRGEMGAELSDWKDWDRGPIGMVRLWVDLSLFLSEEVLLVSRYSSSGGT